MALTPRHPGIGNTMVQHDESSGTLEPGAIVYLTAEGKAAKCTAISGNVPFAISFQRVKAQSANLPLNYEFPGEIGASDARLGDPILLYQNGGIYHTEHYNIIGGAGVDAGTALYCQVNDATDQSKLVNDDGSTKDVAVDAAGDPVLCAIVQEPLTAEEVAAGEPLLIQLKL